MARLWLLVFLMAASAAASAGNAPAPLTSEEKMFIVDDSLKLTCWLMRDTVEKSEPLVVLLHQLGETHQSYQPFIDALMEDVGEDTAHRVMPTIINFDLRGHGKSIYRRRDTLKAETMPNSEYAKIPSDIKHVLNELVGDPALGVDTSNIIVVGASIGANSAALLPELMSGIRKVAMLSPGKSYHDLEPAHAVTAYGGKMMIFASRGDEYSARSSTFIQNLNKSHCRLEWFPGDLHGTAIINDNKAAMRKLVEWVMQ